MISLNAILLCFSYTDLGNYTADILLEYRNLIIIQSQITPNTRHRKMTTVHHCPKASKGNCRKGTGTNGKPICTKHQKNCTNITKKGTVCRQARIIEERCKGPCSK